MRPSLSEQLATYMAQRSVAAIATKEQGGEDDDEKEGPKPAKPTTTADRVKAHLMEKWQHPDEADE